MTAPRKIDPNDASAKQFAAVDLSVLDDYVAYLQTPQLGADHAAAADAHKVIDCLRFIKLNQDFIRYAYAQPQDGAIYRDVQDRAQHILRDCNGTAFYVVRSVSQQQYLDSLNALVSGIERGIRMSREQHKLQTFTQQFRYSQSTGSLEDRTDKPLVYSFSLFESTNVYDLDALFELFLLEKQDLPVKEALDAARKYFEPYLNHPCREGVSAAVLLNWSHILDYMQRKFGPVLPSESLSDDPLSLIKQETVVAKMFQSSFSIKEPIAWPFLINQLADPNHNRPIPNHHKRTMAERANYWNPRTGERTNPRPLNRLRGQPKQPGDRGYGYTKKTAVTLIPRSGKIKLFYAGETNYLGLMFNLKHCYLKDEKYIWSSNAFTDHRNWLGRDVSREGIAENRSLGLEGLKDVLRKTENDSLGPPHNELLIGLSKEALTAIVMTTYDSLATRLNALRFQAYVQVKLNKKLPIVCITQSNSPRIYDAQQQLADILFLMEDNKKNRGYDSVYSSSFIADPLRKMDLQKMRDEMIDEMIDVKLKPIILDHRSKSFIQNCGTHNEMHLIEELQEDGFVRFLNADQQMQLLHIAITRNFITLAQKALELGATLGAPGTQLPNVLLRCYQNGHKDMLNLLLSQLPRICQDSRVMLADTMIACLQDDCDAMRRDMLSKIIDAAKQCKYTLNQLQQASTKQLNFLTLALQQQPIRMGLIVELWGVDFNFPLSPEPLSRPLELAFDMQRPDLVITMINHIPYEALLKEISYLKKIGCLLPVDYSHINSSNILSILTDEKKSELLVSAMDRKDDANILKIIDYIDPSSLRCYKQADTQNTIMHQLLLRDPFEYRFVAALLEKGGYDPSSQNTAGKTPVDIVLDNQDYALALQMLEKYPLNRTVKFYSEFYQDCISRIPYQYFSQNEQYLRQFFDYLSTEQKNNLIYDAVMQNNSAEISRMLALDASFASCFEGMRVCLQRDWSVDHFNLVQSVDANNILILNKIFEYQPHDPRGAVFWDHKKEYRDSAFTALQQSIATADHGVDALKKLFWAREQTMFSKHRSTSRLATIGRTSTVIKIDHLINQSLKQSRHEKVTLLQTPVQAATDNDLIASIQCCQKLLTHELYRIKAKQVQGSFFSRINQSEFDAFIDLQDKIIGMHFVLNQPIDQTQLGDLCHYLDEITNLSVLDRQSKNKLLETRQACEGRVLPDLGAIPVIAPIAAISGVF